MNKFRAILVLGAVGTCYGAVAGGLVIFFVGFMTDSVFGMVFGPIYSIFGVLGIRYIKTGYVIRRIP